MTQMMWNLATPYLIVTGGILVVMIAIAIKRTHNVAALTTVAVLLVASIDQVVFSVPSAGLSYFDLARLDGLSAILNILFLLAGLVTVVLSYPYLEKEAQVPEEFYLLLLSATLGAMVMGAATHFATFVLGMEIVSVSLYAMIAYPDSSRAPLEASLKYLILSGVASAMVLFGMALIYASVGSMNFEFIANNTSESDGYFLLGQIVLWAGIAFKLSLVPFHMWTPDVYQGAPTVVTGYIATVSKGAIAALLLRFVMEGSFLQASALFTVVAIIAILSMVAGNIYALLQNNVKRLLAFSSIAHVGYLLVAVLVVPTTFDDWGNLVATETMLLYLSAYFAITLAAFGVVYLVGENRPGGDLLTAYRGLFWREPWLAAVMTLVALSLAGIPITLGFIAKFYIFKVGISSIAAGASAIVWWLIGALIIGSAIGIFYYLRIIYTMARDDAPDQEIPSKPFGPFAVVLGLGAILLIFGVYPTPLIELIEAASLV